MTATGCMVNVETTLQRHFLEISMAEVELMRIIQI